MATLSLAACIDPGMLGTYGLLMCFVKCDMGVLSSLHHHYYIDKVMMWVYIGSVNRWFTPHERVQDEHD
jgi:nitric oxide reductase large subunit